MLNDLAYIDEVKERRINIIHVYILLIILRDVQKLIGRRRGGCKKIMFRNQKGTGGMLDELRKVL